MSVPPRTTSLAGLAAGLVGAAGLLAGQTAQAQTTPAGVPDQTRIAPFEYAGGMQPVMDNSIFTHGVLDQAEGRWNGRSTQFRYDGQLWSGTDYNKLWIKSEGLVSSQGRFEDGIHEFLYDRAISTYFDLQAGVRVDLDSGPARTWAAFGAQGLSLYFFDVEATAYASDRGRFAARLRGYYDLLITNRLVLQPEAELNFYTKSDRGRGTGSGLSDIDAGLRLRYEFSRKLAPYTGVSYTGRFGQAESFARQEGLKPHSVRFAFGLRTWF
jgi:copper resistance protein B